MNCHMITFLNNKEDDMRILLAEDDYASRKFGISFLSKYGEVDATVDGEEAVAVKIHFFFLVFIKYMMWVSKVFDTH